MKNLFVSLSLLSVAAGTSPLMAMAAPPKQVSQSAEAARQTIPLAEGWRFQYGDAPETVKASDFDDSEWKTVSVPHTWNRIGEYALERSSATNNDQGIGWYRLAFDAPAAQQNMRQYLDFAAVGNVADVWVNGQHVGTHKGAFSRFRLDVTDAWKAGETNLIAVRADNSKPAAGSTTEFVIPLAGDFFISGGMYRPVSLVQLPDASIDPLDFGGPGTYARVSELTDKKAVVDVTTRLRNFSTSRNLTLKSEIRDAEGNFVAASEHRVSLSPGQQEERARLSFLNPRRWNGTADPYLYSLTTSLSDGKKLLDSVTQPLGLRTFRFDADDGFFLNGEHVKLHGVSRHQGWLDSGWALSREQHARDMELIKEMGANTVRHAHYQHADEWSDEADRAGMVVWAELPYVGTPSLTGGKGSAELWANAEQQLRELIRQNYNHPSIMMWSIGNEVDSAKAFGAMTQEPSPIDLLKKMEEVAKEEDPYRPTIFADFSENLDRFGERRQPMTGVADMIAYNRYPGWYYNKGEGAGEVLAGMMDILHDTHPTIPMGISEIGAGAGIMQFSDDPMNGFVSSAGRPQPDEYATAVQEMTWPIIEERDYLFASWVWNMFDFASDLRNEGDSVDINTKGIVSMDRKIKKDGFYYYQAAWTDEPMVHFAGKRYAKRSYPKMTVKAFTNAADAKLTFNGEDMGQASCANYSCSWDNVELRPGANEAMVEANGATDSAIWYGPDLTTNGIRIDAGNLAVSELDGLIYGSDTFVEGGKAVARFAGRIGPISAEADEPVEATRPEVFEYWRTGDAFSYEIPVPNGEYDVTILTLEPGERKIDPRAMALMRMEVAEYRPVRMRVSANGVQRVKQLVPEKIAGKKRKSVSQAINVRVTDEVLKLDFTGVDGGIATVAAIEITPR